MTLRSCLFAAIIAASASAAMTAQPEPQSVPRQPRPAAPATAPGPQPTPAPPAAIPPPRREGQPINIKVEVAITDQRSGAQPLKKTVTVVTGDSMTSFIRSAGEYAGIGVVPLNIDVEPQILTEGRIRLRLNLQYTLPGMTSDGRAVDSQRIDTQRGVGALQKSEIHENLSLILENGKSMIAAQSADPVGDRQVTIEVKATVLR